MRTLLLTLVLAFGITAPAVADIRIHRTDKLGEKTPTTPRFDHVEARAEAKLVFPELAEKHGWRFTQSSDSELFTDEGLKDIDVIVLDNNSGALFNEAEQKAFENFVRNGGGVVGIHGATHPHKAVDANNVAEWPFWYGLWGVLHDTGPKEGPLGRRGYPDQVTLINKADIWSKNRPIRWMVDKVEWYFWNYHPNYGDKEIIAIAEVRPNQPELPQYYPITWCHEYEGGRVWYTNIGHYAENYRQKEFIQHVIDAIYWAAGKESERPD